MRIKKLIHSFTPKGVIKVQNMFDNFHAFLKDLRNNKLQFCFNLRMTQKTKKMNLLRLENTPHVPRHVTNDGLENNQI